MATNSKEYTREYERKNYKKRYAQKKERIIASTKARRMMEKKHGKAALKGKDVHHIKPQAKGGKTIPSNLKIVSRKKNRSDGGKLKDKMYNK